MANFTVRVELHGASGAEYETLHKRMLAKGYYQAVIGVQSSTGKRVVFALPTAEYDHTSNRNAYAVRDEVKAIADNVKPGAWVLVTEVANRALSTKALRAANAA